MARKVVEIGPTGRRLAANVLALRKARGLNQPQLARRMQDQGRAVHATVISKIEQLDRRVDVDDLIALAIALDVAPNRLLLPDAADDNEIDLTPAVRVPASTAWEWAAGEWPLGYRAHEARPRPKDVLGAVLDFAVSKAAEDALADFRRENRPHAPGEARYFDKDELRKHPELVRQAVAFVRAARQEGVSPSLLNDFIELAALTAINGDIEAPSPTTAGEPMTEPASTPEPQPVAAAIVTSSRGVLAGRRNDGKPPWTFIAGEVEPGETAPFAAVREVKEETGLEARAGHEIGRRVHPKTGRTMIYIAAEPVRPDDLDVFVGDTDELAEVRWLSLAEADELLPGMFEPVHAYLERTLTGNR